jgi:antirestriction protein ArdC
VFKLHALAAVLPQRRSTRLVEARLAGDPLAHELTHWTGSKTRLDRDFGGHRFGSESYAVEELVAELGAAFLCADLELSLEPREDHAAYIASWLRVLAADNRAVFTAAARAQRAADFINRASSRTATQVTTAFEGMNATHCLRKHLDGVGR